MKKFTILRGFFTVVLATMGFTAAFAQNPLTTPAGDLYRQGTNSGDLTGPVGTEDPDLVTTGTRVPYLVLPDPILNPTWAPGADATNTTNLVSTFTWTIPAAISSTVPGTGHYITIDVNGAAGATGQISVQEESGASCAGTSTPINVRVIAQPTVSALAVSDGVAPNDAICAAGTNGSLDIALPTFSATQTTDAAIPGDASIRVRASLVFTDFVTGTPTTVFSDAILNVNEATGAVSNADMTAAGAAGAYDDLDSWGTYALTITHISDKISRKDINAADGYFAVNGATGYTATYSVLKTPTTGPIYHLPNE